MNRAPKVSPGILIETNVAICRRLKDLNPKKYFIIAELDDHHLFIAEEHAEWVREEIQKFQDEKNRQFRE